MTYIRSLPNSLPPWLAPVLLQLFAHRSALVATLVATALLRLPRRRPLQSKYVVLLCGGGLEPGMLEYAFPAWAGTHKYQQPDGGE